MYVLINQYQRPYILPLSVNYFSEGAHRQKVIKTILMWFMYIIIIVITTYLW